MPCYNAAIFVEASVCAILAQTFSDFELIIVDDSSTDNSVAILRELEQRDSRIRLVIHEENLGASRARNDGLKLAQGEYIGFCDADDIWRPDKLGLQIKLLIENSSYDLTYCDSEIIDERGNLSGKLFSQLFPIPQKHSGNVFVQLCETNFINMQTVLLRRLAFGPDIFFDESIRWVEDWWQWIRLSQSHGFLYDARILAQYRIHAQSTNTTQKPGILRNRWKVFRRNFEIHEDIPNWLKVRLWYKMGQELSVMRKPHIARKFFCHAAHLSLAEIDSIGKFPFLSARSGVEFLRQCLLRK